MLAGRVEVLVSPGYVHPNRARMGPTKAAVSGYRLQQGLLPHLHSVLLLKDIVIYNKALTLSLIVAADMCS